MSVLIVPPLHDPTLVVRPRPGERLLDVNRWFWDRIGDAAELGALVPRLEPPMCLLAAAAADGLTEPVGTSAQLRALGAAARVVSHDDAGVEATVDDIRLRSGSTQSSADVRRAVDASTLFAPELDRLATDDAPVRLVIEVDQQLPAAIGILRRLAGRPVTVTGRWAGRHAAALSRLPEFAGASFDAVPCRYAVRAPWSAGRGEPAWAASPAAAPDGGRWAGWLDAGETTGLPPAAGLVVTVARVDDWPVVRGVRGDVADLGPLLGGPLAVELLVGAPGADPVRDVAAITGAGVRLAGFRPFRLDAGDERTHWAGTPMPPAAEDGGDLARWRGADPEGAAETIADLVREVSATQELFPGRLAGALFATAAHPAVTATLCWDRAVRQVSCGCGDHLVSLRTGAIQRIHPKLLGAVTRIRGGGEIAERTLQAVPALGTRLVESGALRQAA